jgi:hypothetical protein
MPHRAVKRHWRGLLGAAVLSALIIITFILASIAIQHRARELNEAIYQQCIRDEVQDAVIVAQLEAARRRAEATLPAGSPELRFQIQAINDGILVLEPPGEEPCQPPEGVGP